MAGDCGCASRRCTSASAHGRRTRRTHRCPGSGPTRSESGGAGMMRKRERIPPISTEESRFDRWSTEEIYSALEAQLMEVTVAKEGYRRSPTPDDKAKTLGVLQIKLDTATEALSALRRRIASVANDKRNG